jgi:hypothetical protein
MPTASRCLFYRRGTYAGKFQLVLLSLVTSMGAELLEPIAVPLRLAFSRHFRKNSDCKGLIFRCRSS